MSRFNTLSCTNDTPLMSNCNLFFFDFFLKNVFNLQGNGNVGSHLKK